MPEYYNCGGVKPWNAFVSKDTCKCQSIGFAGDVTADYSDVLIFRSAEASVGKASDSESSEPALAP